MLFPPITKDEIWTSGFVQGITKNESEIIHSDEMRFVLRRYLFVYNFTLVNF